MQCQCDCKGRNPCKATTTQQTSSTSTKTSNSNAKANVTIQSYAKSKWLGEITNNSDYSGWTGYPIYRFRAKVSVGNIYYRVHYKGGGWSSELSNWSIASNGSKAIDGLAMRATGTSQTLVYQVHTKNGKWWGEITGYNINNSATGYAGVLGSEIDGIRVKFTGGSSQQTQQPSGNAGGSTPRPNSPSSRSSSVVYYSQCDSRWKNTMYSSHNDYSQTYCSSSCGPSSMSMIVATFADKSVTPVTMGTYALNHGYRTWNDGTAAGFFCAVAKAYNLQCKYTTDAYEVARELKAGKLAVGNVPGHYICLIDADNTNIYIHDPYFDKLYYSISYMNGKSMWIISK